MRAAARTPSRPCWAAEPERNMASIRINSALEEPAQASWQRADDAIGIRADEIFVRQLDTEFANEVRALVHDPRTGLAARDAEGALVAISESLPMLGQIRERTLAHANGARQKGLLVPLLDTRLDRATSDLGRIAEQAMAELDDRSVADRVMGFHRDAAAAWHDPTQLRALGRATAGELRYRGQRKGWDTTETDATVRQGVSDLYAGAVEAAIGNDADRATALYEHARDVIQPDRQAAIEHKIERAREDRRVSDIVGGLPRVSDDPARRPDFDDYQARAAELTPPETSPEVRLQVNRMLRIEYARADRAWQAARGRAAEAALEWLGKNPGAWVLAMPAELRDGLSPEQTERLDTAAINGGRVVTDRDLYDALDRRAVYEPEAFAGIELSQYRLSLGDHDYRRLVGYQGALVQGRPDAAFERHSLGVTFLDEELRKASFDRDDPGARAARLQLDRLLSKFEAIGGKPATMGDIRSLVDDVLRPMADDPSVAQASGSDPAEADTQVVREREPTGLQRGIAPNVEPVPGSPEYEAARRLAPTKEITNPMAGLGHYLAGSGNTVEYPFAQIKTSTVKPSQFPAVREILDRGQPGTYEIDGKMPFSAPGLDHYAVGNITLNIHGTLELDARGRYSFKGDLGAEPDRYRFYPSDHRGADAELATRIGTLLPGREFSVVIAGTKPIRGRGTYR
ncbi:MAG: lipid II-degrading bacteriocin [Reyranella sp.]|nr:MAG: lipid II-degrading bacteriocin [Reyranella sp.]